MTRQAKTLMAGPQQGIAVTLFNLKYSPNLGDGIISECVEREISRRLPSASIVTLDLAGRTSWQAPRNGRARTALLTLLRRVPRWLGDLLVTIALRSALRKLEPRWARVLRNTDVAVFGGGQLIQDSDLNFPLKLAAAATQCRLQDVPIAVFAVGAAPSRSRRGRQLLSVLIEAPGLIHVAARDERSARELGARGAGSVRISRDPALLAARYWPARESSPRSRPRVGLCITHPAVLRHHSAQASAHDSEQLSRFYNQLVLVLTECGHHVVLFSNGAAEDEDLKNAVYRTNGAGADPRVVAANRCSTPGELVELIAGLHCIVSHREQSDTRLAVLPFGRAETDVTLGDRLGPRSSGLQWNEIKKGFDLIIIDLPDICSSPDGWAFAPYLDGVVLIADDRTSLDEVSSAASLLSTMRADLLGLILNKAVSKPSQGCHGFQRRGAHA